MNQLRRLTFLHRTIRFNIILTFTNDPRTGFLYSCFPLKLSLYTYLAFPSSTEFVLPKNVKQLVHLDSSITAGGDETSVA